MRILLNREFDSLARFCDEPIHVSLWHRHYPHLFNINLSDFQFGSGLPLAKPQISIRILNQIDFFEIFRLSDRARPDPPSGDNQTRGHIWCRPEVAVKRLAALGQNREVDSARVLAAPRASDVSRCNNRRIFRHSRRDHPSRR